MKFKDISKFTKTPQYRVDIPLEDFQDQIEKYTSKYNLQLNPDFQRGNVWNESQQIAYMEFLLRGGRTGIDIYFNMAGWMSNWKGDFTCVDGLQRITAILKFINNEISVFNHYISDYEDKLRMADCYLTFHINNLQTKSEVLTWYIEMNSGGTIHTESEINRVKKLLNEEKNER